MFASIVEELEGRILLAVDQTAQVSSRSYYPLVSTHTVTRLLTYYLPTPQAGARRPAATEWGWRDAAVRRLLNPDPPAAAPPAAPAATPGAATPAAAPAATPDAAPAAFLAAAAAPRSGRETGLPEKQLWPRKPPRPGAAWKHSRRICNGLNAIQHPWTTAAERATAESELAAAAAAASAGHPSSILPAEQSSEDAPRVSEEEYDC